MQRDQTEREHQNEADLQQKHLNELKNKLNTTAAQVIGKQEEVCDWIDSQMPFKTANLKK